MLRVDVHRKVGDPVDARRLGVAVVVDIIDVALPRQTTIHHTVSTILSIHNPQLKPSYGGGTYETIHLPPNNLPRVQPAPPARQIPLAPRQQLAPLGGDGAQHGRRLRDLRVVAAEDEALADAGAQVGDPARGGRWWERGAWLGGVAG